MPARKIARHMARPQAIQCNGLSKIAEITRLVVIKYCGSSLPFLDIKSRKTSVRSERWIFQNGLKLSQPENINGTGYAVA